MNGEIFHVVVMPAADPGGGLARQIAAIVCQPEYQVRLTFAGPLPKIIGHFKDSALAANATESLRRLGLAAFQISESELRALPQVDFLARRLETGEGHLRFFDRSGDSVALSPSDVFLILAARRTVETQVSEPTAKMGLNVPATLLAGGVPIMKKMVVKSEKRELQTEQFIRLYGFITDVPLAEILQHDFDYAFLGSRMDSTTAVNIASTLEVLRQFFGASYFNGSLAGGFTPGPREGGGANWLETQCRLLYRYYQSLPPPSPI